MNLDHLEADLREAKHQLQAGKIPDHTTPCSESMSALTVLGYYLADAQMKLIQAIQKPEVLRKEEPRMASGRWKVVHGDDGSIQVFLKGTFRRGYASECEKGVWQAWLGDSYQASNHVPDVGYQFSEDEIIEAMKEAILAAEVDGPTPSVPKDQGFGATEQDDDIPF